VPPAPARRAEEERLAALGRLDERRQYVVERRTEALHRVTGAREHRTLRAEALLEHVADRVERRAVAAGHDELWKRRRRERVERDLCGPRIPLDHQRPRALEE